MIEVRQHILDVIARAARLPCACDPDRPCLACEAQALLEDLTGSIWPIHRWRNDGPPAEVEHVAGPVITCREYRRSCPGYIVDRRQTCLNCGRELARGKWDLFYAPGERVRELYGRDGLANLLCLPRDTGSPPCSVTRMAYQP